MLAAINYNTKKEKKDDFFVKNVKKRDKLDIHMDVRLSLSYLSDKK